MPINDIDHFVLCAGDKASVSGKELKKSFAFSEQETDFPDDETADGRKGQWAVNATHMAFCVEDDTWVRVALVAW